MITVITFVQIYRYLIFKLPRALKCNDTNNANEKYEYIYYFMSVLIYYNLYKYTGSGRGVWMV